MLSCTEEGIVVWSFMFWQIYIYIWYLSLKDFWNSYRKLAWVRFEPTTTEFSSDTLNDWAIRPWVQLALRANFVQLLQFHLFIQCSHFILAIAFVSCHIYFKRNRAQAITVIYIIYNTYIHTYIHTLLHNA